MTVTINYSVAGGGGGSGGGGGGTGTVKSVNGSSPDGAGNVQLSALSVSAIPQAATNTWNASTNTPTLASSTLPGSGIYGYTVSVAGSTNLDGNSTWNVGDIVYQTGTVWARIAAVAPVSALMKGDGTGGLVPAVAGVDYMPGPLVRMILPVGIAPSGSVANNGVLTLGTALSQTYSNGIWLVFPAGALYAGSLAGAYWCVMSSTTVGQVYTSYIATSGSASTTAGSILRPTSPVAITGTTGPGAYTGVITAQYFPGTQMPAGYLGKQGSIEAHIVARANNTAGGKTAGASLTNGTTTVTTNGISSTTATQTAQVATLYYQDLTNSQIVPQAQDSSAFAVGFSSVDGTLTTSIQLRLSIATATDFVICEIFDVRVIPYPG